MCSHAPALGSPWDIAFGFHVSYATIHAKKYDVIAAINQVLAGNIMFPTTDAGLAHLAKGFAQISRGKGCCAECFAFTALTLTQRYRLYDIERRRGCGLSCHSAQVPRRQQRKKHCRAVLQEGVLCYYNARVRRRLRTLSQHIHCLFSIIARLHRVCLLRARSSNSYRRFGREVEHCG